VRVIPLHGALPGVPHPDLQLPDLVAHLQRTAFELSEYVSVIRLAHLSDAFQRAMPAGSTRQAMHTASRLVSEAGDLLGQVAHDLDEPTEAA
jgi:Zn-dependent alcohol dehydrogenase